MSHEKLLDVRDIERELERLVRERFAQAELNEASIQLIAFDEDANEIPFQEIVDRNTALGLSSIQPGDTHHAQMMIEGPPRGSGVVDGVFSLRTIDWEFRAETSSWTFRKRLRLPYS